MKGKETKYGWAGKPFCVRDTGHYTRNIPSVNLILAVEPGNPALVPDHVRGSLAKPRRWFILTQRNTDQHLFGDFMEMMCQDIETNPVLGDERKILLWDNLSVHLTDYVTNVIENRQGATEFIAIPRLPYKPRLAPVEYIFCEVAMELSWRIMRHWTFQTLWRNIHNIVLQVGRNGTLNKSFTHCGY